MSEENDELLRAYKLAFGSPAGQAVLTDLAGFCRATESCAVPGNHDATFMLLGRNEVWLRIQHFINLTAEQALAIRLGQRTIIINEGDDDEDR